MSIPKKHHYVPQFYLRYFTTGKIPNHKTDYLWAYDVCEKKFFKKSPKNIAYKKYFYQSEENGVKSNEFEDALSHYEGKAKVILDEIIKTKQFDYQDKSKKHNLARFLSFLLNRTVTAKEQKNILMQNIEKKNIVDEISKSGGFEKYLKKKGAPFEYSKESEKKFLDIFNKAKITFEQESFLDIFLILSIQTFPYFMQRNLCLLLLKKDQGNYITSDNPVVLFNPNNLDDNFIPGLADKDTDVIFPISPKICLIMSFNYKNETKYAGDEKAVFLNTNIANNFNNFIFSKENIFQNIQ